MDGLERNEDCPLCEMINEYEGMRLAVPYDEIVKAGVELPPADTLRDEEISRKLDEIISALAGINVCVMSTDHLSDRQFYELLCEDLLREETETFPGSDTGVTTIDVIGGFSEEDIEIYLTYYADDETRAMWERDYPEGPLPEKKPRPYDRDRFLPTLETLLADRRGH